jgi:hypothetical protein
VIRCTIDHPLYHANPVLSEVDGKTAAYEQVMRSLFEDASSSNVRFHVGEGAKARSILANKTVLQSSSYFRMSEPFLPNLFFFFSFLRS